MQVDWVTFMEQHISQYKIRKTHKLDNQRIYNLLYKEVENPNLMKDIREHIRNDLSYKLTDGQKILGLFLVKRFDSYFSLSYYYLDESIRKKPISLKFFLQCIGRLNPLIPIYIKSNKNINLYDRYFEKTERDGILKFKGLRDKNLDDKFKKVLEWVE